MPRALPQPLREEIWLRALVHQTPFQIARALHLSPRTVRHLLRRFRADPSARAPAYPACGRRRTAAHESLRQLALQLRRLHPGWGAGRLRVALAGSAAAPLPAERTLRRWLAQAAPGPGGGPRRPPAAHGRARQPHEVWQMDAKEHIRLLHGECSWLRLVDESTGDIMWREVFPCGGLA